MAGRSPLLRLQGDEKLVTLTRRGQQAAFEALVQRYESRLLSFCRHMLGSREDAEDVLQEVFAAAYNAMLGDERAINVRPWLYRIARNRCLNHLRRPVPVGQDSMDIFERDGGMSTSDTVHKREEFRHHSYISAVATGVIVGLGVQGYVLALRYLAAVQVDDPHLHAFDRSTDRAHLALPVRMVERGRR